MAARLMSTAAAALLTLSRMTAAILLPWRASISFVPSLAFANGVAEAATTKRNSWESLMMKVKSWMKGY